MTNPFARLAAAGIAILVAGCATPYREPISDPPEARYDGITQIAAREADALDVFVVHGMCHHDAAWALGSIDRLAAALGTRATHLPAPDPEPAAEIKSYRALLALRSRPVRVHALVWSGLTRPLKEQLCYDQETKSASCEPPTTTVTPLAYPYQRARLNSQLKDELLNECLSDALIYQGVSRLSMVRAMQAALLEARASAVPGARRTGVDAARASLANDAGLVVIASSLGSKMVFDAIVDLKRLGTDEQAAGERLQSRTRQVFMAANQIPVLALADQDLRGARKGASAAAADAGASGFPPDPLEALFGGRSRSLLRAAGDDGVPVIAFSDPSDLLSYPLTGYYRARRLEPGYPLIDVIVSNAPTVLGLLENPARAHGGYFGNAAVLARIACGHRGWGGCR